MSALPETRRANYAHGYHQGKADLIDRINSPEVLEEMARAVSRGICLVSTSLRFPEISLSPSRMLPLSMRTLMMTVFLIVTT